MYGKTACKTSVKFDKSFTPQLSNNFLKEFAEKYKGKLFKMTSTPKVALSAQCALNIKVKKGSNVGPNKNKGIGLYFKNQSC